MTNVTPRASLGLGLGLLTCLGSFDAGTVGALYGCMAVKCLFLWVDGGLVWILLG